MLRSSIDRLLQSLGFVLGGLMFVVPLFYWISGRNFAQSLLFMLSLSFLIVLLVFLHNYVFDWFDWKFNERVASDRPTVLRIIHAFSLEIVSVLISVLIIYTLTDMNLVRALLADVLLSHVFIVYGFLYHMAIDHIWPVRDNALNPRIEKYYLEKNIGNIKA